MNEKSKDVKKEEICNEINNLILEVINRLETENPELFSGVLPCSEEEQALKGKLRKLEVPVYK